MDGFREEDVPFSVAVLDMDWHLTKIDPKYGKGWTGYTWNRELFPEPARFLQGLHDRGLHVTLNLHPADGVQGCEDAYSAMAEAMGVETEREEPVLFDFTDPKFVEAYFTHLLHPHEDMGVDFWWIDWQQGRSSKKANMDPLWLLNHYQYLDNCRKGGRGMVLSRYAGLGAHRYPAGFSGDAQSTWKSLAYQPWFTATATNVGFPWWSHDIGGFNKGVRDPELFIRWVQFGVFTPFLRLHSSKRIFNTKEPATFGKVAEPIIAHWLRMRHRLIPYLYTEVHRQHTRLKALIRPMYYDHPDAPEAYEARDQYLFGDLVVCPITTPREDSTGMGCVKAWLPKGVYTDIFTGKTYNGGRQLRLHRDLEGYPVLAGAGTILPLAVNEPHSNSTANPRQLEVLVFPGATGSYTMYEDDGLTEGSACYETLFELDAEDGQLRICGRGDASLIPEDRRMRITFRGVEPFTPTGQWVEKVSYDRQTRSVTAWLKPLGTDGQAVIGLEGMRREENRDAADRCRAFLMGVKAGVDEKENAYNVIARGGDSAAVLQELMAREVPAAILSPLAELLNQ